MCLIGFTTHDSAIGAMVKSSTQPTGLRFASALSTSHLPYASYPAKRQQRLEVRGQRLGIRDQGLEGRGQGTIWVRDGALQSITKVFISIGYVSLMYRLCSTYVLRMFYVCSAYVLCIIGSCSEAGAGRLGIRGQRLGVRANKPNGANGTDKPNKEEYKGRFVPNRPRTGRPRPRGSPLMTTLFSANCRQ